MLPNAMPDPQIKSKEMVDKLFEISKNKINEIEILKYLLAKSNSNELRLIKALIYSNKIILEDLMRESDFMLPQGKKSLLLLSKISNNNDLKEITDKLLKSFK